MITETTKRALEIIRNHRITMPRQFAEFMWPDNPAWKHHTKCGPSGTAHGGGMNLAGGAYLGKLRKRGLITGGYNDMPIRLTAKGQAALEAK